MVTSLLLTDDRARSAKIIDDLFSRLDFGRDPDRRSHFLVMGSKGYPEHFCVARPLSFCHEEQNDE